MAERSDRKRSGGRARVDEWVVCDTGIPLLPPYGAPYESLASSFEKACAVARVRLDAQRVDRLERLAAEYEDNDDIRSL